MPRKCGLCKKEGHNRKNCENAYYKGEYNYKGEKHGKGTYEYKIKKYQNTIWQDAKYEGDWVNGKREGIGQIIFGWDRYGFSKGDKYEGEWYNDKIHGAGVMVYANGDKYNGKWGNNYKHGEGIYTDRYGSKFEGTWDGQDRFKGTMTFHNWIDVYPRDRWSPGWKLRY